MGGGNAMKDASQQPSYPHAYLTRAKPTAPNRTSEDTASLVTSNNKAKMKDNRKTASRGR